MIKSNRDETMNRKKNQNLNERVFSKVMKLQYTGCFFCAHDMQTTPSAGFSTSSLVDAPRFRLSLAIRSLIVAITSSFSAL